MTAANSAAADVTDALARLDREALAVEGLPDGVENLSGIQLAVMFHQIRLCLGAKSKSWRTRRLNDFARWLENDRRKQMEIAG